MEILEQILVQAAADKKRIVLPEVQDSRVLEAAVRIAEAGLADIILPGKQDDIMPQMAKLGLSSDNLEVIDPAESALRSSCVHTLYQLRRHKGLTEDQAEASMCDPLVFAATLVNQGYADGMVAGAAHTTADVVRTAIQVVGMKQGCELVSSFFLMVFDKPFHHIQGNFIFADCALVVDPDAEQLAQIALAAVASARSLLIQKPRVAMLSFSTHGSAEHESVTRVAEATCKVTAQMPTLEIDGDIQLDAAIVKQIADRKCPGSKTDGQANVLIFPDLNAGNIGYKLAERLGQARAIGPLLQGLRRPVNDLSRGCCVDDIYHVIAITAVQAQSV